MITTAALISKFQEAIDDNWGYIYGMTNVKWTAARQKNYDAAKAGDKNCQNSIKYGPKWYNHWVTDCSGLFTWAFNELGGKIYHGSNTIFKSYCSNKGALVNGKRKDGKELKAGTAVFTGTEGSHGHIGLYCGGYVIEAKGAQYGVVKSPITDKRWTWWGELKDVTYDGSAPAPEPAPDPEPAKDEDYPTLKRGSKGRWVTLLQTKLISQGYSCGSTGADGDFGANTEKAVKEFQKEHDGQNGKALKVDGIVGPETWWAIEHAPERITYTVTIRNLTKDQKDKLMKEYPGAVATPEE